MLCPMMTSLRRHSSDSSVASSFVSLCAGWRCKLTLQMILLCNCSLSLNVCIICLQCYLWFLSTKVLQGSAAMRVNEGRIFNDLFIANLPLSVTVKEYWRPVRIWQCYGKKKWHLFFPDTVYCWQHCLSHNRYMSVYYRISATGTGWHWSVTNVCVCVR